jgi:hypothetical protein
VPESRQTAGESFAIGTVREVCPADNVAVFYSHTLGASQLARREAEVPGRPDIRVPVYQAFYERVIVQIHGRRHGVYLKDRATASPR